MSGERGKPAVFWIDTSTGGGLTILDRRPGAHVTLSYDELVDQAERKAAGLAEHGIERGAAVGLFAHTTFDYITGCLAIWRRGAVVVSLPTAPRMGSLEAWIERSASHLRKAKAKALLLGEGDSALDLGVPTLAMASLGHSGPFRDPFPEPSDIALIQFSSGSTSHPKGVQLDHRAVTELHEASTRRLGPHSEGTDGCFLSWLPLSHDWGLLQFALRPMRLGRSTVLMPTEAFVEAPLRWLEEIGRWRAVQSPAPNSAYGFVARLLERSDKLDTDLASWTYAGNGGEPVDVGTLEAFSAAAARYGFEAGALVPGYGLAEATCDVSVAAPGSGWRADHIERSSLAEGHAKRAGGPGPGVSTFVSVGPPLDHVELTIADDAGHELPERSVGEIVVRSQSVMRGYIDDPGATGEALRGEELRTGDLGYMADGELFITGRMKDIIIVGGRNYHAEDIERVVETVSVVRKGAVVALPVRQAGAEGIGVIAESRATGEELLRGRSEIRARVLAETGVGARSIVFVEPRSLPKTTSGKLRRAESKRMWEQGELTDVAPLVED